MLPIPSVQWQGRPAWVFRIHFSGQGAPTRVLGIRLVVERILRCGVPTVGRGAAIRGPVALHAPGERVPGVHMCRRS